MYTVYPLPYNILKVILANKNRNDSNMMNFCDKDLLSISKWHRIANKINPHRTSLSLIIL